ncbi:MAG: hypothetical protein M3R67_05145 [Acidobacteriota bacterium]|nr:hypothetical protein [Acidobacteriota bacterium]
MSPRRTQDNDIFGNGLRERVTACRKRLRMNRSTPKALVQNEPKEVIEETTTVLMSEFHGYPPEYRPIQKNPMRIDHRSFEFEGTESRNGESLLLVGEQEVGIT